MFSKVSSLLVSAILTMLTGAAMAQPMPPINKPDVPTGAPNAPPAPNAPSNPGAGGVPQQSVQQTQSFTNPLYSVQWATSELPWFPVGLILAMVLGYYLGYRKGPSPWEKD